MTEEKKTAVAGVRNVTFLHGAPEIDLVPMQWPSAPFCEPVETSIAGDTASDTDGEATGTAVAALERQQRREPKTSFHYSRPPSSKRNSEAEVGNMGLFFGNWGIRGTVASKAEQLKRRTTHDRQVLGNPGQTVIIAEASKEIEELLKQPEMEGRSGGGGLESRSTNIVWCEAMKIRLL